MEKNKTCLFRPLLDGLTIKDSSIEGLGLFTKKSLEKDFKIGISHVKYKGGGFHQDLIRTATGAFINHSTKPNCRFIEEVNFRVLITSFKIKPNTELTVDYSLSECGSSYVDLL